MKHRLNTFRQRLFMPSVIALSIFLVMAVAAILLHPPKQGNDSFTRQYYTTLSDYQGKSVRFESFKGKPLIVYFWATWCPYCGGELQALAQLKAQHGSSIDVLAVNRGEPLSDAKAFTDALNLGDGVVLLMDDHDALFKRLNGYAMPETVFIDPTGDVVLHQHGPLATTSLEAAVEKIIP